MGSGNAVGWFGFPSGGSPSRLLQILRRAGYLADPPAISRYECVYLETQDGRLGNGGYRLSLRLAGRGGVWHASGPDGESEEPFEGKAPFQSLSPDSSKVPPVIAALSGGRLLFPLVRLKVKAWAANLQSPAKDTLLLRVERFLAAPPRESWPKGGQTQGLLGVRQLDGNPDAFLHLLTYLRDRLGLPADSGDPCRAALQALDLPEPGAPVPVRLRLQPEDPLALAGRKVVGQQVLKMRANVRGTLDDLDPEYLHDLRVATRRLRSALRLFAGVLGPRRCVSLRGELRWIGGLLGAVRDLDVFVLNLQAVAQRLGEAGAIAGLLVEELQGRRGPARTTLVAALASPRFRSLLRRLDALASSPPPRRPRGIQGASVTEEGPVLIRKVQKRVLRLGRTIGPDSPTGDLHRLRILFKRLRYACEFFQEAFTDPASGTDPLADHIQAMVRFQDCLGEHQDAVVAMARTQELANAVVQHGELAAARLLELGALIQVYREMVRERRSRLSKLWARFDKPSVRKPLAAMGRQAPRAPRAGGISTKPSA